MISLTPNEVERRFALLGLPNRFDDLEKQQLITTPIVDASDAIIGFPVPLDNKGLNILSLRQILGTNPAKQPSFFDHPWYLDELFATKDCEPGWHFLYKHVLEETVSQSIYYKDSLTQRGLELPGAAEVTLMLFLHYAATGEQLLQKKHTWCRDQASLGRFVTVGAFGRNGLFVSGHPGEFASRGLGICAKLSGQFRAPSCSPGSG